MGDAGIEVGDLDENSAVDLVRRSTHLVSWKRRFEFIIRKFFRYLGDVGVARPVSPPALDDTPRGRFRREYEEYLRGQRGLSERSVSQCWWSAKRFLKFRFGDDEWDVSQIEPADIVRFLQYLTRCAKPSSGDKTPPSHFRAFFLFLFKSVKTATNLAPCVPRVAHRRGATLPRHLTPEEVDILVAAVRADTPIGRRNYAMGLLQARLGLRAPEVVAIQIDDIDWRAGEILIRGKGLRHDRLPLPQDVGEALTNYICHDRRTTSRSLFSTLRAPYQPLASGDLLNVILQDAFARTGLKPPAQYIGSHILRHSLATTLLRRGAPLDEIADLLRHRSRQSTMVYAKLDTDGLRSIALPWPGVGGTK